MKKIILLLSLLVIFSCEDKDETEESNSLVGTWEITNVGEYANADCSGAIDDSEWALMAAFGLDAVLEFTSGGNGTYIVTAMGETQKILMTWDESKSQICFMGVECSTYKLNDNKLIVNDQQEAYCEDNNGEDTSDADQSTCEAAGNSWFEKSCQRLEFTKK